MIKSVYIHIPFCMTICSYCDFCKFYYNQELVDKYLIALNKEIKERYQGEEINTIYIGGGTPSCLNLQELTKLFEILKQINVKNIEYTIECNIENIDEAKLQLFKKYGINRLSIGIQTFNKKHISYLNRHHTKEEAIDKINLAKKYFDNISIDLIYAIPNQTLKELSDDLDIALALNIAHISTYSLIIEPHTILYNDGIKNIDEDLDYEMYRLICTRLKNFEHYEISNFGKFKSKHNLTYWNNEMYYGFGAGASGYIGDIRYTNTRNLKKYFNGNYVYEEEKIALNIDIENEFILGLRKLEGIDKNSFYEKYNIDLLKIEVVKDLIKDSKLIFFDNHLKLNYEYLYTSNDILINFIGIDYKKYFES